MTESTYTSRFCRIAAPESWQIAPGIGLFEEGIDGPRRSAVLIENWLDPPLSAEDYAASQQEILTGQSPSTEVVSATPVHHADHADARLAVFRTPLEAGGALLQHQLVAAEGPLVGLLTVSGREDDRELWSRISGSIFASFEMPARSWVRSIRPAELITATPPDEDPVDRHSVRDVGISIPLPSGWQGQANGCTHSDGSQLTIRRDGLPGTKAEECFAKALARLGGSDDSLESWQQGTLEAGRRFFALEQVSTIGKTWGEAERHLLRELYLDDEGVLAFVLNTPDAAAAVQLLSHIVHGYQWLPAEERWFQVERWWISVKLDGVWIEAGTGVWQRIQPSPVTVQLQELPNDKLDDLAEKGCEAARNDPSVAEVIEEKRSKGPFRGRTCHHHAMDYQTPAGETVAARTFWLDGRKDDALVTVRGADRAEVESVFKVLLEGVRDL